MGAAHEHGIIDALTTANITAYADTAYQGGGPIIRIPQWHRRLDPDTSRYRWLSASQKQVNTAHARVPGKRERAAEKVEDPAQDPLQPIEGHRP